MPTFGSIISALDVPSTLNKSGLTPPLLVDSGGIGSCTRTLSACGHLINYF